MTATTLNTTAGSSTAIESPGGPLARYAWLSSPRSDCGKFTSFKAHRIEALSANSQLMSWLYDIISVTTFSSLLGVVEVATAVLLAVKPGWSRLSAAGSVMAIGLFVATFTFLFSTPGVLEVRDSGRIGFFATHSLILTMP